MAFRLLQECKCAECKKVFCPAPLHIYKDGKKVFCKWTCYNAYIKRKESKKGTGKNEN